MRYYLYVSDAKIEMLVNQLPQLPQTESKLVLRGGIGKWFGLERHVEKLHSPTEALESKLARICEFIRESENVGKLYSLECDWIEDTFDCYLSYPVPSETGTPVVLLHHQTPVDVQPLQARRQVLLVGSAAYLTPRLSDDKTIVPLPPGGHWQKLSAALARILND